MNVPKSSSPTSHRPSHQGEKAPSTGVSVENYVRKSLGILIGPQNDWQRDFFFFFLSSRTHLMSRKLFLAFKIHVRRTSTEQAPFVLFLPFFASWILFLDDSRSRYKFLFIAFELGRKRFPRSSRPISLQILSGSCGPISTGTKIQGAKKFVAFHSRRTGHRQM